MATNEKKQLTPEQRRRRMEIKKRKQKELQRRKRKKRILIGTAVAAGVLVLAFAVFQVVRFAGSGSSNISAKGDTFIIALDPGHGGEDLGMGSGEALEKDIDLKICSKLKIMLESQGYQVIMTREDDTRISAEDRTALINESGADLLVSVHCNYSESDTELAGAVSSYQKGSKKSRTLAENIQTRLTEESGAANLGTESGSYTILDDAEMPAVLIQPGYLSNAEEAEKLSEDLYQNDVAKGIAYGVIASLDR